MKNRFIFELSDKPFTKDYTEITDGKGKNYVFIGQINDKNEPDGFIRCINQSGNIYEGNFTPQMKLNGFCVSYIGNKEEI